MYPVLFPLGGKPCQSERAVPRGPLPASKAPHFVMWGGRVGRVPVVLGGSFSFLTHMPQYPGFQNKPVQCWGQPTIFGPNVPLSSGGVGGNQRSSHRDVPLISSPPGGGNLVQCLGLWMVPVFCGGFYPYRAGVPLLGQRTG